LKTALSGETGSGQVSYGVVLRKKEFNSTRREMAQRLGSRDLRRRSGGFQPEKHQAGAGARRSFRYILRSCSKIDGKAATLTMV